METKNLKSGNDPPMSVIKQNIHNCFRYNSDISIILDAVNRTSVINFHTDAFIKLFFVDKYVKGLIFPEITKQFIIYVMKIVSLKTDNRGAPPSTKYKNLLRELNNFYDTYYYKMIEKFPTVSNNKLTQILVYEATQKLASINTNIKEHYTDHLSKFIKINIDFYNRHAEIKKCKLYSKERKTKFKDLYNELNNLSKDFLNIKNNTLLSNKKHYVFIKEYKWKVVCKKKDYSKKSVNYDVCVNPQDYLNNLFFINSFFEQKSVSDTKIKMFNVLPLKLSLIPTYITIDTFILATLLNTENTKENCKVNKNKKNFGINFVSQKKVGFEKIDMNSIL